MGDIASCSFQLSIFEEFYAWCFRRPSLPVWPGVRQKFRQYPFQPMASLAVEAVKAASERRAKHVLQTSSNLEIMHVQAGNCQHWIFCSAGVVVLSLSLSLWVGRIGPNSRRVRTKLLHVLGTIEPIQPMRHTTEFVLLVS